MEKIVRVLATIYLLALACAAIECNDPASADTSVQPAQAAGQPSYLPRSWGKCETISAQSPDTVRYFVHLSCEDNVGTIRIVRVVSGYPQPTVLNTIQRQ